MTGWQRVVASEGQYIHKCDNYFFTVEQYMSCTNFPDSLIYLVLNLMNNSRLEKSRLPYKYKLLLLSNNHLAMKHPEYFIYILLEFIGI